MKRFLPVNLEHLMPMRRETSVRAFIGSKQYQLSSDDDYLSHIQGEFEPDIVNLFTTLVEPDHVALDIGANIGCTTILFANIANKVFSFEPSPTTFHFLQKNVDRAKSSNVTLINMGLGKVNGQYELTFSPGNRSGGFVSNQLQTSAGHQVEQITILKGDDFISNEKLSRVDFVKIDVEGFEWDVIEGLRDTLDTFKPVVALELNHWCLNAFQRITVPDFFDFLRNIFPYLYAVDKTDIRNLHNAGDSYHVMYHHIVNNFQYPNLVGAFRKEQLARFSEAYDVDL